MRFAIVLAAVLATSTSMMGGVVSIVSPDHPQTFTYGEMIWHELYLGCRPGGLAARITFSNWPYAVDDEPRSDEPFDFRFPGVRFDAGRQTFFANGRQGKLIEVARFHS